MRWQLSQQNPILLNQLSDWQNTIGKICPEEWSFDKNESKLSGEQRRPRAKRPASVPAHSSCMPHQQLQGLVPLKHVICPFSCKEVFGGVSPAPTCAAVACQNLIHTTAASWVKGSRISLKSTTNITPTASKDLSVIGRYGMGMQTFVFVQADVPTTSVEPLAPS